MYILEIKRICFLLQFSCNWQLPLCKIKRKLSADLLCERGLNLVYLLCPPPQKKSEAECLKTLLIWFMQFLFYKSKCFQHFSWMNSNSLMLEDWILFFTWYQIELFHLSSFRTLGLYIVNKLCWFFLLNILGTFYFKLDLVMY